MLFPQLQFALAEDVLVLLQGRLPFLKDFALFEQMQPIRLQLSQEHPPVLLLLPQHLLGVIQHRLGQPELCGDGQRPALTRHAHQQTEGRSQPFFVELDGGVLEPGMAQGPSAAEWSGIPAADARVPMTEREIELIDGMIEVQLHHAERCDYIANRVMADKQKGWDMERVALLEKMKANGITGAAK